MAGEATMLSTPSRGENATAPRSPVTSSPSPASDDDTISDNSFDSGTDHFTFTPKQRAKIPRAWERKPATPFAPRTETQKIWKRVPLQERTNNVAVEIRASDKNDANARGVKRVRLTVPGTSDGKENYANTVWDKELDEAKRKIPKEQKSVLQSTRNSLSPLRRDITLELLNCAPPPSPLELEAERVIQRLEEMQDEKARRERDNTESDNSPGISEHQGETCYNEENFPGKEAKDDISLVDNQPSANGLTPEREKASREEAAGATPGANSFFTDSVIFDDLEDESEISLWPPERPADNDLRRMSLESGHLPDQSNVVDIPEDIATACLGQESIQIKDVQSSLVGSEQNISPSGLSQLDASEEVFVANRVENVNNPEGASVLDAFAIAPGMVDSTSDITSHDQAAGGASHKLLDLTKTGTDANNAQPETVSASDIDLSRREIGTSEVLVDLKSSSPSRKQAGITLEGGGAEVLTFGSSCNALNDKLFTPQAPNFTAAEAPPSEDTAYLHDFLTRARAQKAARTVHSPEKMAHLTSSPAKNTRQALASLSANAGSPSMPEQPELKPVEPSEEEMEDDHATSPCRRSSRPRLPKQPKSVIPAIPNTIPVRRSNGTEFVFLQRTEAMQVALATRNNTKRNKGEAVPPSARLETLANGQLSPIKDRKRNGKMKKIVTWNERLIQEQLAAGIEDRAEVTEKAEAEIESKGGVILAPETEKREKRKVKRLGTVNGTPAPKKVMAATALPVPTRTLRARTSKTS